MEMDADTLERLLVDRALGGLPPDTEALLSAYLADRAEARALGERIGAAVLGAKAALADGEPARVPLFPADVFRERMAARRRWAVVGRVSGLAACVLIGIGLHAVWMSGPATVVQGPGSTKIVQRTDNALPLPIAAETHRPGFWSGKQWYEKAEQNRSERNQRVIWDSPLARPRLGAAT